MFKLFNYKTEDGSRVGILIGEQHHDLRELVDGVPTTINGLLERWDEWLPRLSALTSAGVAGRPALDPAAIQFAPPVAPGKIFCAGGNYAKHQLEMRGAAGVNLTPKPYFFTKAPQCVIATGETIRMPDPAQGKDIDWEGELAVIIGKATRNVKRDEADEYIAGYGIFHDVTARDRIKRTDVPFGNDWLSGKNHETFAPMGPYFVPRQFIVDRDNLSIRTWVDDELHQDGNTRDLIIKIPEMIENLSALLVLYPGDVIATGTPAGVGHGKGVYLKSGQRVIIEIEGIGRLENPVV